MNSQHSSINSGAGIVLLILLALIGSVVFMLLGGLVCIIFTDASNLTEALSADYTNPNGLNAIRVLQSFQTLGLFIFPAILLAFLHSKQPFAFLGFKSINVRYLFFSIAFMFIALPGINFLASLNALIPMSQWATGLEQKALEITEALLTTTNFNVYLANILVVAILPALGEELFFRGVLQPFVTRVLRNSFWGIFVTAALFSAIHFQFQGFIPRLALGIMFGYLYLWSGSLWAPIAVHFINNASATTVFYLIGKGNLPGHTESIGELNQLWVIGALSVFFASIMGYYLWKTRPTLHVVVG